jgi:preprotein translocase subunit SecA
MVELVRSHIESNKAIASEKKREWTALINSKLDGLSIIKLRPILKELGLKDDPLSPENMNEIARIFEVSDSGLEFLEEALTHGIPHNILNAKFHEKEAIIIAEAGRKGQVTIATNMAGRGVDILLGGKHINQELPPVDGSLKSLAKAEDAVEQAEEQEGEDGTGAESEELGWRRGGRPSVLDAVTTGALTDEEHKKAADEVRALGGLFILGTERHESRRIDNQLRGRSGRQGDPGESRFFVSLEDELWRLFGDRANHPLLRTWEEHLAMDAKMLSGMIQRAQKKVEEHYFEARKHVLNYDDVMNRQRELIYKERRRILEGVDLKETILDYIRRNIEDAVNVYAPAEVPASEWELDELFRELDDYFMLYPVLTVNDLQGKSRQEMIEFLTDHVLNIYEAREQEMDALQGAGTMRELERWMALRAINARWMEHLANMDYLREGIHLRSYEQRDPLLIYQKEAFDEFERMQQAIQDDIVRNIFRVQVVQQPPTPQVAPAIPLPTQLPRYSQMQDLDTARNITTNLEGAAAGAGAAAARSKDGAPPDWKGGRNDPCWCGSGLKYKKCHGK